LGNEKGRRERGMKKTKHIVKAGSRGERGRKNGGLIDGGRRE